MIAAMWAILLAVYMLLSIFVRSHGTGGMEADGLGRSLVSPPPALARFLYRYSETDGWPGWPAFWCDMAVFWTSVVGIMKLVSDKDD